MSNIEGGEADDGCTHVPNSDPARDVTSGAPVSDFKFPEDLGPNASAGAPERPQPEPDAATLHAMGEVERAGCTLYGELRPAGAPAWGNLPTDLRERWMRVAERPQPIDDPEADYTDFAHPAWWRGEYAGLMSVVRALTDLLDRGEHRGTFGEPSLESLAQRIAALLTERPQETTVKILEQDERGLNTSQTVEVIVQPRPQERRIEGWARPYLTFYGLDPTVFVVGNRERNSVPCTLILHSPTETTGDK